MRLTDEQVRRFRDEGVLVAEGVVTAEDLAPLIAEYEAWIDGRARLLHAEGKITDLAEGQDFSHRFATLYAQSKEIANGMDVMFTRGPALFAFLKNENLLDAVESLVGPEITCNPIQHIRAKAPASATGEGKNFYNVPWHQDMAVTWTEADDSDIITCWLALVDATIENGCMSVIPNVWRNGYLKHEQGGGGPTIPADAIPEGAEIRPVPVRAGGIVFMHRCTPHTSSPNYSDGVRWSLDLRYQKTGTPTGRPFHPEFVARSKANPESVLQDHAVWSARWKEALENAKGVQAHRV
jgi:phytanoyl-CoA hydroxylase